MSLPPSLAGPLGRYLQSVSPAALRLLMSSINRERRRGATPSEIETLIIATARKLLQDDEIYPDRQADARRRMFAPLEPYLVDGVGLKKQPARIERRSLSGIWTWLERDLIPGRFAELIADIDAAIGSGDEDHANVLADAVRQEAAAAIQAAIDAAGDMERAHRKLAVQAGGGNCLHDARDFIDIVQNATALRLLEERLPSHVTDLNETHLARCTKLLDAASRKVPAVRPHAIAVLMRRLEKPVQIVRLAVHDTGSDEAGVLSQCRYAVAGSLVLYDIMHAARSAARKLKSRASEDEVWMDLFDFYTLAHGLRVEVELPKGHPWTIAIGRSSRAISDRLQPVISAAPRLVKAALLPRGGAIVHAPDDMDVADAEYAITMIRQTRSFISELALNDALARATKELDHYLSLIADTIVERLRNIRPDQYEDALALLRATGRLTRAASGDELAELVQRAGRTALGPQRAQQSVAG